MAIVVIAVGLSISMCFQLFVKEDPNYKAPKLKWHKWLMKPDFYLVSACHALIGLDPVMQTLACYRIIPPEKLF